MNNLLITNSNDEGVVLNSELVKRVPRNQYNDFKQLLQHLLEGFLYYNGGIGDIHNDSKYRESAIKLISMLPIVGSPGTKLDAETLLEDYDQCRKLMYTVTPFLEEQGEYDPEALENGGWKPSLLASLHGIDYTKVLWEANLQAQARLKLPQETEPMTPETQVEKQALRM